MTTASPLGSAARLLVLLLVTGVGGCAASSPKPEHATARERHPAVSAPAEETCLSCHARTTPQVAKAWQEGRHGLTLVLCFVCHGTTGADFRLRPEPGLCAGCHARNVQSAMDAGGRTDCFACHPAHALRPARGESPHRKEGGQP